MADEVVQEVVKVVKWQESFSKEPGSGVRVYESD